MNVAQLIAALETLPPHLPVIFPDSEDGEADVRDVRERDGLAVLLWYPR